MTTISCARIVDSAVTAPPVSTRVAMWLLTSLLVLVAAGSGSASPLPSQQEEATRTWLSAVPSNITFDCHGRIPGYYADVNSGCQMYHMCDPQSRLYSYLCPAFTEFSQFYMTCVQHDRVNCSMSESFFHMNEMIGQPRTRFHDHRQHDHSKKKDTEGSKATNRVDTSKPAGHVLFEFEAKMDVPLKKVPRSRSSFADRSASSGHRRSGATPTQRPTSKRKHLSTPAPPPSPPPRRLFKTLSPPGVTTAVTEPTRTPSTVRPQASSRVTSSGTLSSHAVHGNKTASAVRKARPRIRFSDLNRNATSARVKARTTPRPASSPAPISAPSFPALPRNTYHTFGLPGSFSFGTLLSRTNKAVSPLPLKTTAAYQSSTPRPTAAPPTRARSTKASPTRARPTAAPPTRARSTKASPTRARSTAAPFTRARLATAPSTVTASQENIQTPQIAKNATTTAKPFKLKPRARLTTTARDQKRGTTQRTTTPSHTGSTTTRSSTTQVTTPRPTTTPSTTRRPTTRRTTLRTTTKATTAKPTTFRRKVTRPTTAKPTNTRPTSTKPRLTSKPRTRRPSTSRATTTRKSSTTRNPTTEPTTVKSTTTTPKSTSRPRSRTTPSVTKARQRTSSTTERPPVANPPTTEEPKTAPSAPPVPSLLTKELPPVDELEALHLSFTLDPPRLAEKPDGPHEERNMKVRGELITGEMALRKLVVDQLKPVYFPNPSLPLNLLPPLLSEQATPDGHQTTTLTLPIRRQSPDALLQAAAVAFNILPPELASLVPPLLTPPPPPLPSGRRTSATSTDKTLATSADKTPATSTRPTPTQFTQKPKKNRPGLTMKFGKKKTRFRLEDVHRSPKDACYPCMKSFIKDLDRCHPCVIIR